MANVVKIVCVRCKKRFERRVGCVNRARKLGAPLYCDQKCAGKARRRPKLPKAVRRARKAAYDKVRREQMRDEIRAEKREYHKRTYTYEKGRRDRARAKRRYGKHHHRDYCRRYYADPKKKAAKVRYDQRRRDRLAGEFRGAVRALIKLERAIRVQVPDKYERAKGRGYYERSTQERKRNAQISRW